MPLDDKDNMPEGKMKYEAAYAAPAAIQVDNSCDMDVTAAFTYWYASQEGMDLASNGTSVSYQQFGYAPGFQVGVGFDTHFDDWTLDAEYTWYNKTQTGSATGTDGNEWGIFSPTATVGHSSWKLSMNTLDLDGGRPFYQSKKVTISPVGGLRFLWIKQTLNLTGSPAIFSLNASSSSWAVGPKFGVNSHWMFWKGLRVDGMLGSSLLYTKYTTITSDEASVSNMGALRPTMEMGLGLGYGMYCFDNTFYFDLSARYDFMQYWSQNMIRNFTGNVNGHEASIGDLQLQGFTLTLRCDF
jgi:hypothetical protein